MYISLYDAGIFILFVLAVVIGIYVIIVLRKVLGMITLVQGILDVHKSDIGKMISMFQGTLTHLNEISISMKEVIGQVRQPIRALPGEFIDTVDDLRESLETFTLYAKVVVDVIKTVFAKR